MKLIIDNKQIVTPIEDIINQVKLECSAKDIFHDMKPKADYIMVTCPYHKGGHEQHPSCSIYTSYDSSSIMPGTLHCLTCGASKQIWQWVGYCFEKDDQFGKDWLIDRFGDFYLINDSFSIDEEIKLTNNYSKSIILSNDILDNFAYYHPYLLNRKISFDIAKKYNVGWDSQSNDITFPIWDKQGNLVGINRRNVTKKIYKLAENINKEIYLLNFILKDNVDNVWVTESQINALDLETKGFRAIALLGTGCKYQYEILKKSGIRQYTLALDGDLAGRKGIKRFIENMPNDIIISVVDLPNGKDINDLTDEEFRNLNLYDKSEWLSKYEKQLTGDKKNGKTFV